MWKTLPWTVRWALSWQKTPAAPCSSRSNQPREASRSVPRQSAKGKNPPVTAGKLPRSQMAAPGWSWTARWGRLFSAQTPPAHDPPIVSVQGGFGNWERLITDCFSATTMGNGTRYPSSIGAMKTGWPAQSVQLESENLDRGRTVLSDFLLASDLFLVFPWL